MKMLEICLKLVGCKSKKGLSSSSSCYLEGKGISDPCAVVFAQIFIVRFILKKYKQTSKVKK